MDLKNFEICMMEIKKYLDKSRAASKALQVLADDSFIIVNFADSLLNAYIKLLAENVGDKGEWIDWFLFENDFGEGGMDAGKTDADMHLIDTIEKLYNIIKDIDDK